MGYFENLFGGNKGGLAYTLGNNGNGSYVASNGSNSYTYGNAADAASALDDLNFGVGQTGGVGGGGGGLRERLRSSGEGRRVLWTNGIR